MDVLFEDLGDAGEGLGDVFGFLRAFGVGEGVIGCRVSGREGRVVGRGGGHGDGSVLGELCL